MQNVLHYLKAAPKTQSRQPVGTQADDTSLGKIVPRFFRYAARPILLRACVSTAG